MNPWIFLPAPTPDFPGSLYRFDPFPSDHVPPRRVDFWLPAGYDPANRYPVLYMHDGQNLFIPAESYTKITWGVAETLTALGIDWHTVDMAETPGRMVAAYRELLDPPAFDFTTFPNTEGYDELVLVHDIEFQSLCEHHLLPFVGVVLLCLLVITYVPSLSLALRDLVYAK
mgnify:CR=1 FL=1